MENSCAKCYGLKFVFFLHLVITLSSAQLVSLDKTGNVGVNFGGFSAGAGLGGLVTGDTADGGLHAYAQTPYGQRAAAGLDGNVKTDGSTAGGLYAGAQATGSIAAGANLDGQIVKTYTKDVVQPVPVHKYVEKHVQTVPILPPPENVMKVAESPVETPIIIEKTVTKNNFRRPHQRRKYAYINARINTSENPLRVIKVVNVDAQPQYSQPQPQSTGTVDKTATTYTGNVSFNKNGNLFNDIFNIPISTLKAVNQLVNNILGGTSVAVSKEVTATAAVAGNTNVHKTI